MIEGNGKKQLEQMFNKRFDELHERLQDARLRVDGAKNAALFVAEALRDLAQTISTESAAMATLFGDFPVLNDEEEMLKKFNHGICTRRAEAFKSAAATVHGALGMLTEAAREIDVAIRAECEAIMKEPLEPGHEDKKAD